MSTQTVDTVEAINNESASSTPVSGSFADGSAFGAAYERRLPEILAVKEEDLVKVIIDVQAAVATVLGALPQIRALREDMAGLSTLDVRRVDGLEDYAQALAEASSRYIIATTPQEDVVALNEAALKAREILRADARALALRGLIPKERLTPFKGLTGYKNVAFELLDWANLLAEYVLASGGRLSLRELTEAKRLGERLVEAAAQREQAPPAVAEAARIRQQALTLLVNAYSEVRRAVSFLRWREADGEDIAPSLYAGRHRKRAAAPRAPVTAPAVTAPAVATPAVATPAVTAPAVATPAVTAPAVATPAVATPAVTASAVATPAVTAPAVTASAVATPAVTAPAVTASAVATPAVATPAVTPRPSGGRSTHDRRAALRAWRGRARVRT